MKNSKNYIQNLTNETLIKKINEVEGEQIIIENCVNCNIIVLDYSAQVTIEKCKDCNIFLGPCKSNVFLRNSEGINIICACQQFRARSNNNVKLSLFSMTRPAIEDCTNLQVGCFNFDYTGMLDAFNNAELNIWDNQWSEIHVFSGPGITFFDTLTDTECYKDLKINVLVDQEVAEKKYCSIPFTYGLSYDYKDLSNYHGIMLFESNANYEEMVTLCDSTMLKEEECFLIKTFNFTKDEKQAEFIKKFSPDFETKSSGVESFIGLWIITKKDDHFYFLDDYIKSKFEGYFNYTMFQPKDEHVRELAVKIFDNFTFNFK